MTIREKLSEIDVEVADLKKKMRDAWSRYPQGHGEPYRTQIQDLFTYRMKVSAQAPSWGQIDIEFKEIL